MAFYVSTNPKYNDGSGGGGGGGEVTIVGGAVVLLAATAQTRATDGNIYSGTIPGGTLADGDYVEIFAQFGNIPDGPDDLWNLTIKIAGTTIVSNVNSEGVATEANCGSYMYFSNQLLFVKQNNVTYLPIAFNGSVDQTLVASITKTGTPPHDAYLGAIALVVTKKEVP